MTPEDVIAALSGAISLRRRILHLLALLGGGAGAAIVGLLWATEPGLPPRTQVAFAVLVGIAGCWTAFGAWALIRRPLFAIDRVVGGWLGVGATATASVAAVVITTTRHRVEPALFATMAVLIALAVANLVRARRHRAQLLRRKRELGG